MSSSNPHLVLEAEIRGLVAHLDGSHGEGASRLAGDPDAGGDAGAGESALHFDQFLHVE
jgi:hypothetical protein